MGLLDDLKKQAEQVRAEQESAAAREARLERHYQEEAKPRLRKLQQYLQEMTEQIRIIQLKTTAAYDIPGIGTVSDLVHEDYRTLVDSAVNPKRLSFRFACRAPAPGKYKVSPVALANHTRRFLEANQVVFTEWPVRDRSNETILGAVFQCRLQVQVQFLFTLDLERNRLVVASQNFEGLRTHQRSFPLEAVDDAWLDQLGHYLLRRGELGVLELSDQHRESIRRKMAEEERRRRQELEAADADAITDTGRFERLFDTLRKPIF